MKQSNSCGDALAERLWMERGEGDSNNIDSDIDDDDDVSVCITF